MADNLSQLRTLLADVVIDGTATIKKAKLLLYLGKSQDRPAVWSAVLAEWQDMGQDRETLHGLEVYGNIVLTMPLPEGGEHKAVSSWADK